MASLGVLLLALIYGDLFYLFCPALWLTLRRVLRRSGGLPV
ncbi:hypothetical protein I5H03_gp035 [Mycobacterium phage Nibb]|uniref:Uncharacterized protein n=1 Tax=Mycobacterium phage Nibb TaxID=2510585 RepID=A0A411B5J9_9CAUD|nr:hypothetical protein I5H03_gp035 [Mycobacterium phage Nibb]QAX95611.1 hypothetical protein SEA_NIBB_72 [Mycobacterium phage Nibb]